MSDAGERDDAINRAFELLGADTETINAIHRDLLSGGYDG